MKQELFFLWVIEEEYLKANINLFEESYTSFQKYSIQEDNHFVLAEVQLINREHYLYDLNRYYQIIINNIRRSVFYNHQFHRKAEIPYFRSQIILFCDGSTRRTIKELCFDDERNFRFWVHEDYSKIDWTNFYTKSYEFLDPGFDIYGNNICMEELKSEATPNWNIDRLEL